MENKVQKEELDSTEFKIEEIESDISDDWEFMSKHEAEMESVPHLSVPEMHEQIEKCDSKSDEIGIDRGKHNEQRIFSHQAQEKEQGRVQKEIEEAMQENFQCEEENERVRRELHEIKQTVHQNELEIVWLRRDLHEQEQIVHQNELEKVSLRRELLELEQTVQQNEVEKVSLRRDLHELEQAVQQNELEKASLRRELHELKQTAKPEQEKNSDRREAHGLNPTVKPEQEKDSGRREVHGLNQTTKPEDEKDSARKKYYELKRTVLRATESSEPQIHAIEGESSAKGVDESKTNVLSNQFNEAFRQLFRVNQPAKVVIQDKKTDKLEEKKHVELSTEHAELFQKGGIEFASSDDESKE